MDCFNDSGKTPDVFISEYISGNCGIVKSLVPRAQVGECRTSQNKSFADIGTGLGLESSLSELLLTGSLQHFDGVPAWPMNSATG